MAGTVAQSRGTFSAASGSALALAYAGAVTAARTLVAFVGWGSSSATCSVADSVNGAWTPILASLATGPGPGVFNSRSQFFILGTTAVGTPTVTATISASVAYRVLHIFELDGVDTGDPVDDANGAVGNSTAPAALVTGTAPSALVLGGCLAEQTSAPGAGFTAAQNTDGNQSEYANRSSGAVSVAFTQAPSGRWVASAVALADAVDPAPGAAADGFVRVSDAWVATMGQLRSSAAWI